MSKYLLIIPALLFIPFQPGYSQESIAADITLGCDSLNVSFTIENAGPQSSYSSIEWDFGDGHTASGTLTPVHRFGEPGIYDITCTLNGANQLFEPAFIEVGITPQSSFRFTDSSATDGECRYYFEADYTPANGSFLNYQWRFPGDETAFARDAFFTFQEPGIYEIYLEITDPAGCSDTLVKRIPVSDELLASNVFTPNDDGVNDYFRVTTPSEYTYIFRVFTRNGIQVHKTRSPKIFWDGRSSAGLEMPEGVYYYVIESTDAPEEITLAGFLHLYR